MVLKLIKVGQIFPFLAFLALASTARSEGWKPEAIEFAHAHYGAPPMEQYDSQKDPYVATLWGGASRKVRLAMPIQEYRREMTLPDYFDRPVEVELSQHFLVKLERDSTDSRNHSGGLPVIHKYLEKAPLVVFVPGIFSDSSDITGQMTIKWFSAMGYHVLVVPNPLAPAYIKAGPRSQSNPTLEPAENDAKFVLAATRYAIATWIKPEWVTDIMIAGESLGSAVAAAAYAQDSLDPHPLFNAGATLTWPPISLANSIENMDSRIASTQAKYDGGCRDLISNFRFKIRILFAQILKDPTEEERDCAESLVMNAGYKGDLIRSARILKTGVDPGPNDPTQPQSPMSTWEKGLTFSTFIRELAPSYGTALDYKNPITEISHWLGIANAHNHSNWRILTSVDDFVNDRRNWKEIYAMDPEGTRLLTMAWGGHIGLSATPEFPDFLAKQMAR